MCQSNGTNARRVSVRLRSRRLAQRLLVGVVSDPSVRCEIARLGVMRSFEPDRDPDSASSDVRYEQARFFYSQGRYGEALALYRDLAEDYPHHGDLLAFIGQMHLRGLGTGANRDEAVLWYQRAADAGSPDSCVFLAGVYFKQGRRDEARRLLERAAETNYLPALYYLGRTYELGNGVPIDIGRAYRYFAQAAAKGHVFAQRQLAVRLIRGREGFVGRLRGLRIFAATLLNAFTIRRQDPSDERILA
jgi:TPR repeat protein